MNDELYVLDLFAGIGGFASGLARAGFKTVGFCEIEPFCRQVLTRHWPDIPVFEDVTELTGKALYGAGVKNINVITGGFPCQDISLAGKGAGIAGERSGLWKEYLRIIDLVRPKIVIVENVSALTFRGLGVVLGDLAEIGYDAMWDCIPASAIGAPHRRDRIWIVAYPAGTGLSHRRYTGQQESVAQKTTGMVTESKRCGSDVSNTHHARCDHDQSQKTREHGEEGWAQCPENPLTGGDIAAAGEFSLHQAGSGKDDGGRGLPDSETILADTHGTGAMGGREADRTITGIGGSGSAAPGGSRGDDSGQHQSSTYEAMADTNRTGLQGFGQEGDVGQILTQEAIGLFRCTRGIEQWGAEPDISRLEGNGLNPDWVEWLMGFEIGWTRGGKKKQRLVALGNAVVPLLPELIGLGVRHKLGGISHET